MQNLTINVQRVSDYAAREGTPMKVEPVSMRRIRQIDSALPPVRPAERERESSRRPARGLSNPADERRRAAESAAAWLAAAGRARDSAGRLADPSLWTRRAVRSSDPEAIAGVAKDGAPLAAWRVEIMRTARAQRNRGFELAMHGASVIEPGRHAFRLTRAGKTYELAVEIEAGDTNAAALARLAGAINGAEAGVRAVRREVRRLRLVWLELSGAAPGARGAFELADEDGSAVSASGIGTVTAAAEDAVFRVNGGPDQAAPVNETYLDHGLVRIAWRASASGAYDLAVGYDADAIAAEVRAAVGELDAMAGIHRASAGSLQPELLRVLDAAMATDAADRLGIARAGDGWTLDEGRLRAAVRDEPEASRLAIAGSDGWAAGVIRTMERFLALPAEALIHPAVRDAGTYAPDSSGGTLMQPATPASGWYFDSLYY
jgi:hypothetical protein